MKMYGTLSFYLLLILFTILFAGCGDSGSNPDTKKTLLNTGIIDRVGAERTALAFANALYGSQEAQIYAMILILGDVTSNDTRTGNTRDCLDSGTRTVNLQDTDGNGSLSAGESVDISFNNCSGATSTPVNGMLQQTLHSFDADFSPDSILATNIRQWNATYKFTQIRRTDKNTKDQLSYDGEISFDYNKTAEDWTLVSDTVDFQLTNGFGSVYMKDLSFSNSYIAMFDRLSVNITGSIKDSTIGLMTIESWLMQIENYSGQRKYTGTLIVNSQLATLRIDFADLFNFTLSLDTNNDGIPDDTWAYSPGGITPAPSLPNVLEGSWAVYQGGFPSLNNETFDFQGSDLYYYYLNTLTDIFTATFADTSTTAVKRFQATITAAVDSPSFVGEVMNCIYEYDSTGLKVTLACNDPGNVNYPTVFTAAQGVTIWDLEKRL